MRFDLWALGLAVAGGVAMFVTKPARSANDDTNKVLRHMVMYKFKDNLPPADLKEVVDTFAGLPKKIDTIIGFEHGTNVSREGKSDGLTHCFVVTFRDEKGLATYLDHPAHQHYVEVARDRREKVVVFDYWATK